MKCVHTHIIPPSSTPAFSLCVGTAGRTFGLDHLKGLLQPKWFHDSWLLLEGVNIFHSMSEQGGAAEQCVCLLWELSQSPLCSRNDSLCLETGIKIDHIMKWCFPMGKVPYIIWGAVFSMGRKLKETVPDATLQLYKLQVWWWLN